MIKRILFIVISLVFTLSMAACGAHKEVYPGGAIKYEGGWSKGQPHGNGKAYFSTNNQLEYDGGYKYAIYNGKGKLYKLDEATGKTWLFYDGEWKDGEPDGKGTRYYTEDKLEYVGEWKNGLYSGKGVKYFAESNPYGNDRYDGEWKEGNYDGEGTLFVSVNGKGEYPWVYHGGFKNNRFEGEGSLTYVDKEASKIMTASGRFHDGDLVEGNHKAGGELVFEVYIEGEIERVNSSYNKEAMMKKSLELNEDGLTDSEVEEGMHGEGE